MSRTGDHPIAPAREAASRAGGGPDERDYYLEIAARALMQIFLLSAEAPTVETARKALDAIGDRDEPQPPPGPPGPARDERLEIATKALKLIAADLGHPRAIDVALVALHKIEP